MALFLTGMRLGKIKYIIVYKIREGILWLTVNLNIVSTMNVAIGSGVLPVKLRPGSLT